ncbi:unnamed protein product [Rotaria sp. Silwood2]|nr:unnamed protein product [Rotaria sp. Silwood2]
MRTSKTRSSLNTSSTNNDSSFRWQQCSQCLKSIPNNSDNHQCSDELNGLFVEHNRARLLIQEHKSDYFKDLTFPSFMHTDIIFISPETMRLLRDIHRNDHILLISTTKDQQRTLRIGLLWSNSLLADNQVAISRTVIDQLSEQQMIELRAIPKDHILDTDNVTLRAITPCESRSTNERRLITICLKHQLVNRIVFDEQHIDFVYLGQSIIFRIEKATDDINLIDSLHSLSLDSNLPKFYRIYPLTTSINIHFESTTMNNNNIQVKSISLSDIGGLKKEKSDLIDLLVTSTTNYIPPRGILLHGPKGCGKTMLINAIAHEISATIIRINPSDIYSRHYGESETKLKHLFAQTNITKNNNLKKKYLLIVENIESLCPNQERITQQLERRLTTTFIELLDRYLDGKNIFLIATTNRLDSVDTDIRRPGRIDEEIEIGVPNQQDRLEILQIKLQTISNDLNEEQLKLIAERTHGFSGSDLENLCRKGKILSNVSRERLIRKV